MVGRKEGNPMRRRNLPHRTVRINLPPHEMQRLELLLAALRGDRGGLYSFGEYVEHCVKRCLKVDCEDSGIADDFHSSVKPSQ